METAAAIEPDTSTQQAVTAPYAPSWINLLSDWIDRLPGPNWLLYPGLGLVLYLGMILSQWTPSSGYSFHAYHVVFAATVPYALAVMHYLDRKAGAALIRFRPVLDGSEAEYAQLRYRMTTLPARSTLWATVFGVVTTIVLMNVFPLEWALRNFHFESSGVSLAYTRAVSFAIWACGAVFVYHTVHQLTVVSQVYRRARINLFRIVPLYAFSDLSARTAIAMMIIAYAWFATVPEFNNTPTAIVIVVFFILLVIVAFLAPLLGAHDLLVAEKLRLLAGCVQRQEAAIAKLHDRLDTDNIDRMDDLNKAMASLEIEHATLSRISTWPWQPETLRWFTGALFFPVALWLVQWMLQIVLGL
ncbi:MAG: hypothetical protein IT333_08690 [Thermomicrobiales bacterium]|nr:hypothetical protein [Thermomicrobiales bacterium]